MKRDLREVLNRPHETRVRAPRVPTRRSLFVEASTIGTAVVYPLVVENFSRTGMLLTWQATFRIPFNESTLVELRIDPECSLFAHPLKCLGKVVRRSEMESGAHHASFGIHIVQMEAADIEKWESVLGFEEQAADLNHAVLSLDFDSE